MNFFIFFIFQVCGVLQYHPQEDLTMFGYRPCIWRYKFVYILAISSRTHCRLYIYNLLMLIAPLYVCKIVEIDHQKEYLITS
jgi:hypothetical protein